MNEVEFLRHRTLDWIIQDMAALETKLVKMLQEGLNEITPPTSYHGRSQLPKRRRITFDTGAVRLSG